MKLLFKWAKSKHRPTVRRYKSTKPSLNFSLLDYYSTLTGSILTWLTMIYFSSLGTLEHSRSRTKNTSNKQWRWIMALIPYLKIFPTKIVKNMILKTPGSAYLKRESIASYYRSEQLEKYSRLRDDGITGWMASSTRPEGQEHEFGLRVRMPRCANLLPVALVACPVLVS